jgi:threonine dehydrogenase-like Zn-dependent dehydrogenase
MKGQAARWKDTGSAEAMATGRIDPGRVFDRTIGLTDVPEGYRAMDERKAIKVMAKP